MVQVRVQRLKFSDGQEVPIPTSGIVILVGPNNAGKSQTLKDLKGHGRPNFVGRTLHGVDFEKSSDGDESEWFEATVRQVTREGQRRFTVPGWGEVALSDLVNQWQQAGLANLTELFILHADGTSRLTAGDSQASIDFTLQAPGHPVQVAYIDPELESELEKESRAAFGLGVVVDRYGGSVISLRLGERPDFQHEEGRPTLEYLEALKNLGRLEEQGDGIRSYLGLVLHVSAGTHQILLVDEPEAFLHPPQAKRLGKVMARQAKERQAVVATHSSAIVQGALEAGTTVTIARITRDGDVNHAAVLDDEAVKRLWSDPLLRYSNVLDGLFHDAVVLCEADSDCRYYSAVLDHRGTNSEDDGTPRRDPQLLFTHCGGKARMSSVVQALRAVSVPVVVVSDFDVLRDATDVERIVTSLGGDMSDYEVDLRIVSSALESDAKPLRKITLRDDLNQKLDNFPDETVDQRQADTLRAVLKVENGWDKAKRAGKSALPQGEATEAAIRLLSELANLRFLVVPVGELERFVPEVSGHGPGWVTSVLEQKLHESPGEDAVSFVRAIREAAQRP